MKLALLSLGLALVGAYNAAAWCVPSECKVDSNCVDSIHPGSTGRCCGGKCVRDSSVSNRARLIGEQCYPSDLVHADTFEQCFAQCSGGLFCNTVDEKCHAKRGAGCSCLANRECLSNYCREGKCSAIALGERCSLSSIPCVADAICRRNGTLSDYYCLRPCAVGEGNCCYSGNADCATTPANLKCNFVADYTCSLPPGLDESCIDECRDSSTMTCALACNITGGGCGSLKVCQLKNQLQLGLPCDRSSFEQCVTGSSCLYDISNGTYVCTVRPSQAPTGAPSQAPTSALNSVPLGGPCGDARNYDLCMAPGNMCEQNESGIFVCKQSGTTPVDAFCSISRFNIDVRALDECVKGSRCTQNATFFGSYACRTQIPVGQRCYSASKYSFRDYSFPECENGYDNCEYTGRVGCFGSCDGSDVNGNPCCTCITPRTVRDGGNCSTSSQCQQPTSLCLTENYTCGNIQGIDCITPSNCRDARFDCSCDRKCYLLNAPTPSFLSSAPTASTRAPSISTPRCETQKNAWELLPASKTYKEVPSFPIVVYSTFHTRFAPETLKLTEADQSTLIAYVCCETCFFNDRFNSHIYGGFQVDCNAKKLIKLEDTCNDLRGTWGMANCWGALSAAPSLNLGLGVFFPLLLLNLWR